MSLGFFLGYVGIPVPSLDICRWLPLSVMSQASLYAFLKSVSNRIGITMEVLLQI